MCPFKNFPVVVLRDTKLLLLMVLAKALGSSGTEYNRPAMLSKVCGHSRGHRLLSKELDHTILAIPD